MTPEEIAKKYGGTLVSTQEEDTYPDEVVRRFGKQEPKPAIDIEEIAKKYGGTLVTQEEPSAVNPTEIAQRYGGVEVQPRDRVKKAAGEILANTLNEEESLKQGILPIYQKRQEAIQERGTPSTFDIEFGGMAPALGMDVSPAIDPSIERAKLPETTWKELTQNETNKKIMREYFVERKGKAGEQQKGESDEEYANRIASHMRGTLLNVTLKASPELAWLKNSTPEQKRKASLAWQLWDTVPEWYKEEGQPGVRPFAEGVGYTATDPLNYIGLGVGKYAALRIARGLIEDSFKTKAKTAAVTAGVTGAIGAGASALQQEIEIETGRRDEIDPTQVVIAAGFDALFGAAEVAGATAGKIKSTKQQLAEALDEIPPLPASPKTQAFKETLSKDLDDTVREYDKLNTEYDKIQGRKTLEGISEATDLTESQVRKDIFRKAIDAAGYIIENDPLFKGVLEKVATKEIRTIDAIKEVYMSIGRMKETTKKTGAEATEEGAELIPVIDPDIYEAALIKYSIGEKEFGQALRATAGDAGSLLASLSQFSRNIQKATNLDKEAMDIIDRVWGGKENVAVRALSFFGDAIKRVERNWKAIITSMPATTMLNAVGSGTAITLETGKNFIESSLLATGKTLASAYDVAIKGKPYEKGAVTKGLNTIFKDTFNTLVYLRNAGLTAEITSDLLKYNPKIKQSVFSAMQETGTAELNKAVKFANTLNVVQDSLVRSAVFVASVERQTRRVGMNMFSMMKEEKRIPSSILNRAGEEALRMSFAYMPKKGVGHAFVKFFEFPGMSLINPFPRFMVNAMSFIGKYTPVLPVAKTAIALGAVGKTGAKAAYIKGKGALGIKTKGLREDEIIEAERAARTAVEGISESLVGLGAFLAAYQYRKENQDTPWNEMYADDNTLTDTRNLFPVGPYLALADVYVKAEEGRAQDISVLETIRALAGLKLPTSGGLAFIEGLPELAQSIIDSDFNKATAKGAETLSKMVGDYISGFFQPVVPFKQYLELFIKEAQIAKDPNLMEDSDNLLSQTIINRIKNKFPMEAIEAITPEAAQDILPEGLTEPLPEAVFPFREGEMYRPGSFFGIVSTYRLQPERNRIEQELQTLNIPSYKLYPTSGIRYIDREIMRAALPYMEPYVLQFMDTDLYESYSRDQKIRNLPPKIRQAIAAGRAEVLGTFSAEDEKTYHKLAFNKLPAIDRRIINDAYAKDNDGRSIDQDKAYEQFYNYLDTLVVPRMPRE